MTNDDPMYVRHLEQALEAAELEIKGLENEARKRENLLAQMQEQLNPTHMGEPASSRKQIEELQSRIALLAVSTILQDEILREIYEVWARSEGVPIAETATEAYLFRLIEQMRNRAKEGIK